MENTKYGNFELKAIASQPLAEAQTSRIFKKRRDEMSQALISSQNFSGTLLVSGRDIRFRAEGRKNRVQKTNAGFNKKTGKWILVFGRYGRFEIRKGQLSALDAELTRLFEAAARLQAA